MTPDPLARVHTAIAAKKQAEREYVASLAAAYRAGVSYAELGRLLVVSRQAVRQLVERSHIKRPDDDGGLR